MLFRRKTQPGAVPGALPAHIGIIMDGNGRWAKKRGLPRSAGHKKGAEVFEAIARHCNAIGVGVLTVYAFSTENWRRPPEEVDAIMSLFGDYLERAHLHRDDNIRTRFIGDRSVLSQRLQGLMREAEEASRGATGLALNIAINYGGRDEIVRAAGQLVERARAGEAFTVDEAEFQKHLDTAGLPPCDLIIRPSGEARLSNFMLWQSAYSELVFMDVLWPDFTPDKLDAAIRVYGARQRRFGGI